MEAYLTFDKISEEIKFQLRGRGKLRPGREVAPNPIVNYAS